MSELLGEGGSAEMFFSCKNSVIDNEVWSNFQKLAISSRTRKTLFRKRLRDKRFYSLSNLAVRIICEQLKKMINVDSGFVHGDDVVYFSVLCHFVWFVHLCAWSNSYKLMNKQFPFYSSGKFLGTSFTQFFVMPRSMNSLLTHVYLMSNYSDCWPSLSC